MNSSNTAQDHRASPESHQDDRDDPCLISNASAAASLSGRGAGWTRPDEISHNAAVFPLCVRQSLYEPSLLLLLSLMEAFV